MVDSVVQNCIMPTVILGLRAVSVVEVVLGQHLAVVEVFQVVGFLL